MPTHASPYPGPVTTVGNPVAQRCLPLITFRRDGRVDKKGTRALIRCDYGLIGRLVPFGSRLLRGANGTIRIRIELRK